MPVESGLWATAEHPYLVDPGARACPGRCTCVPRSVHVRAGTTSVRCVGRLPVAKPHYKKQCVWYCHGHGRSRSREVTTHTHNLAKSSSEEKKGTTTTTLLGTIQTPYSPLYRRGRKPCTYFEGFWCIGPNGRLITPAQGVEELSPLLSGRVVRVLRRWLARPFPLSSSA